MLEIKKNQKGLSQSEQLIYLSAKETVEGMDNRPSLPDGTVTVGLGGCASVALEGCASVGIVNIDDNGNVTLFSLTLGGGLSTGVSASGGVMVEATNATNIDELQGWFVNTGGAYGEGTVVGVDPVFGTGSNGHIDGLAVTAGPGAQVSLPVPPLGIHVNGNYTWFSPLRFKLW